MLVVVLTMPIASQPSKNDMYGHCFITNKNLKFPKEKELEVILRNPK